MSKQAKTDRQTLRALLRDIHECPDSFNESDIDRIIELAVDPHVESILDCADDASAIMAINNYDAHCLTSNRVPFIDVDSLNTKTIRTLQSHLGDMGFGGKLYQTRKGYRIALNQAMSPSALFTRYLSTDKHHLRMYGIDYSYALFSFYMGTYRARCSAKPWRLVAKGQDYERLSRYELDRYPVVRYLSDFGSAAWSPHLEAVLSAHNRISNCTTSATTLY